MMSECRVILELERAFLNGYNKYSTALAERLSFISLILMVSLAATLFTVPANGESPHNKQHKLTLSGDLPTGAVGQDYHPLIAVAGGTPPYQYAITSGTFPPGLNLNLQTGKITGRPTAAGTFTFEVVVTDTPQPDQGSQLYTVVVHPSNRGGGGGTGNVTVDVSPSTVTLSSGQTQQFTATVSGTAQTGVTWWATTGSVDGNGLYTAPAVNAQTSATVTATSTADSTKSASATVTVNPANNQPLQITTGSLPQGQQGDAYNEFFSASGGATPYSWSITGGTTPPGLSMNGSGDLAGMPNTAGTFNFTVTVRDAANKTANGNFSVTIVAGGNFDGPAELPRATVPSAMSDSPAPGTVISVNAGGDLQSALNGAHCGDVIQLQAAATFTGKFIVPAKNCDNAHWIIVRTSSPDSALPPEGQRATPCYAGVASLEGRPQYPCANPKNVMAKVQMQTGGDGPIQLANGANYYRFIGLEVTRPVGTPGGGRLISGQGTAGTSDHIVYDRMWLHGASQDETHVGVNLDGATNAAVVDSYFSDFHCISKAGSCTDAHAVAGGVSNTQDGPYKIQNNFLEASGEAILFGGGPATLSPSDIEVRGNHFWKPWQWMKGSNPFVGGPDGNPFIVKNHLELKNAVRVLIEANLMENCWGGFSQTGHGIVLTPKNQHTPNGQNVCPLCQVTDVTIRYVHVSHSGGGIQMATALSASGRDGGGPALAGTRWSIHDVLFDDLSKNYLGGGEVLEIGNTWPKNAINTVTVNHITGFPDPNGHMMVTGNLAENEAMYGLVFTNNVVITARYPVWNTGGKTSCAVKDIPVTTIKNCFTSYVFANNALVAAPSQFPPSSWPANNMFPQTVNEVQFVDFNNGNGGNYALQSNSPYKGKGTDGKDLGADISGLNAALANVE